MSFITTVPVAEATDDVRKMYEQQQASLGYVPNYAKVFSQRPAVMAGWRGLLGSIRANLDPRRYELVTLAAARALHSSYCSLAHGTVLRDQFYDAAQVGRIAEDFASGGLAPADVAIMRFTEKMVYDASAVTEADVQTLRAHGLTDAEIFDVAAVAAARCFFSKLLDALGAEPDAAYNALEADLRQRLTVGRPISAESVEQLA